jgi:PKD repeat protein
VTFTVRDGLGAADPTPDTRVITVTGGNQAPNGTISAPTGPVTIAAGQTVSFSGSGTDPDNNLPLAYAWNFGGGAINSALQNPGAVTFANAGTFTVSFTVTDGLGLADPTPDTRVITVTGGAGNQAPNGVIATPAGNVTITAGQSVSFTGNGTDPDNNLPLTYAWNFGGGAANSTAQNPGLVTFATAGTFTVSFTVTDGLALADPTPDTRTITVNPVSSGGCTANLLPNPGMELGVTGWKGVGGTIAQVAGGSSGSFALRLTGAASTSSFYIEDTPRTVATTTAGHGYYYSAMVRSDASTGTARIRIMEYAAGVKVGQLDSPALTLSTNWQKLEVSYTPVQSGSELYFTVKDSPVAISETFDVDDAVYCPLAAPLAQPANASPAADEVLAAGSPMKALVAPNPMVGLSQLKFSTTKTGPLRVAIFDVSGRRVRMLADESQARPGLHILTVDDRGDNGARLDSGIYFYRIRSADGLEQGRFLIMN